MILIRFHLLTLLLAVALCGGTGCGGPREAADPEVTQLIRQLRQGQLDERRAAAEELGRRKHPRAVPPLILSLTEPQAPVRQAAAVALGEIGDKRAVPGLVRMLTDVNVESRKLAAEALGKIGDPDALAPLLERLTDPELTVRYSIGPALGKLGPAAATPLLAALQDTNPIRRASAAMALGYVHDPRSTDALLAALNDPLLPVRLAAAEGLGVAGDDRAVEPLAKLMVDPLSPADYQSFKDRQTGPIPPDRLKELIKTLVSREGRRQIPAPESGLQRLNRGDRPPKPDEQAKKDVVEEESDRLRALITEPATPAKMAEVQAIIVHRIGEDRWNALTDVQKELATQKEVRHLDYLLAPPTADVPVETRQETLHEIIAYRLGSRWWNNLSPAQQESALRREHVRPLEDEQRYAAAEMRRTAATALAKLRTEAGIAALLKAAASSPREVSDPAQGALQAAGREAIEPLTKLLLNPAVPYAMRSQGMDVLAGIKDPQLVDALLTILTGSETSLRVAAAGALGRLGDRRAAGPLAKSLTDADPGVRAAVARALGGLGDAAAVEPLLRALPDKEPVVTRAIIEGLDRLQDPRATVPVRNILAAEIAGAKDEGIIHAAVRALGRLKDAEAVPLLIPLLDNPTKENRDLTGAVCTALGRIGDRRAVEPLLAFLQKKIWGPCFSAATALGEIGDPRAIDLLVANLDRRPYPEMPPLATAALGKINDPRTTDILVGQLRHPDTDMRKWAAEALIAQGARAVPRLLKEFADDSAEHRGLVAQTLGYIGAPALDSLLPALDQPPRADALPAIIYALSMIRDPRVVAPLTAKLADPNADIRANAAWALGFVGSRDTLPALKKLLDDPDRRVRTSAQTALDKLLTEPPAGS